MRRYLLFTLLGFLLCTPALAQLTMDQVVVGSVGGSMAGGTRKMDLTVGQVANGMIQSGSTSAQVGFWWQISMVPTAVEETAAPLKFALRQNTPNPFTLRTMFTFVIPNGPTPVTIGIFDPQGRLIRTVVNESKTAGIYSVPWDGRNNSGQPVATGIYFAKFLAGKF